MPGGIAHNTNGDFWEGYHTDPQQCGSCGGDRSKIGVDGDFWKCSCGHMWEKKTPPPEPEPEVSEVVVNDVPVQVLAVPLSNTWQIVVTAVGYTDDEIAQLLEKVYWVANAEAQYKTCEVDLKKVT